MRKRREKVSILIGLALLLALPLLASAEIAKARMGVDGMI